MTSILERGSYTQTGDLFTHRWHYLTGFHLHRGRDTFVENLAAPNIPQIYDAPGVDILDGYTQTAAFPLFTTLIISRLLTL